MQYIAAGSAAVAAFVFTKNGVPTTPGSAPTITAAYYNGTLLSPLPAIGSPATPGEYTPTVFTTGQTGTAGYYFAVAYTADTTMDNQISIEEWAVGTSDATSIVAAIYAYAKTSVTIAGSAFKYILDTLASIVAKTDTIGTAEFTMNAPDLSMASAPIVAGRSYKLAYGNQLSFTISNLGVSLLAANVSVVYNVKVGSSTTVVFTATITGATTGYFTIDSEDTEDWGENRSGYYAEIVVLDATDPINVQIRPLIVLASVG